MQRLGLVTVLPLVLVLGCDVGRSANQPVESPGAGGSAGTTGGSPATAPPHDEDFKLLFRDDFDVFDTTRWQLMTHSWASNLALFSTQAATVADGMLTIALTPAPAGTVDDSNTPKPFLGAEVRSLDTLTYGRVRTRAKLAAGSAVVSSLVTIYTPWPADNWNELDIEHLGAKPTDVQLNAMVYTGPPKTPPVTTSVTPTPEPLTKALGFDASADFHVYTLEWTPSSARFSVDDTLLREWTTHIDLMTLPQNVLMTIWASNSVSWAGAVTDDTGKATAVYDWIELYQLMP
ncbi:MAG: glycoside hydrolase family 16 protein [Myxococcales bacterium]